MVRGTRLVKNLKRVEIFDTDVELPNAPPHAGVARLVADLSRVGVSRNPSASIFVRRTPSRTPCKRDGSGMRDANFVRVKIAVLASVKDAVGTLPVRTLDMTAPTVPTPDTKISCQHLNTSMKFGRGGRRLWSAQPPIPQPREILSRGLGGRRKIKETRLDYVMPRVIGALGLHLVSMRLGSCERLARWPFGR